LIRERGRRQGGHRWGIEAQEAPGLAVGEVEGAVGAEGETLGVGEVRGEVGEVEVRMHLADGALGGVGLGGQLLGRDVNRAERVEDQAHRLLEPGADPGHRLEEHPRVAVADISVGIRVVRARWGF